MVQERRDRTQQEENGNQYRALVGKPEGKRPLGRLRHRWNDNTKIDGWRKDNTKTDIREIRWVVWTGFIWLRTGTSVGNEPSGFIKTLKNS
jgi:hypothetical protein